MKHSDLRSFISFLEQQGELVRITQEVDPNLEMTEISDRTLRAKGPALLFENPKGYSMPVLLQLLARQKGSPWVWGKIQSLLFAMWVNC